MGWIRNLEALAGGGEQYSAEYELGSECQIYGLLDYADGKIICASMGPEKSKDGLWLYNLILRYPLGPWEINREASDKGYYFKDGVLGELLALMSVFFRCRVYLIASRVSPGDPRLGMTIKTEYPCVRVRCSPASHPPLFGETNRNFATGFKEFLDEVQTLNPRFHQDFILACHHYARSVRDVGVDTEMVFIRLVSAIEALATDVSLDQKDDKLEGHEVTELVEQSGLNKELRSELKAVFDVRKSRKKFVRFVEQYSTGFFKGGNSNAGRLKFKRADLERVLNAIYTARSRYLHAGEPMYLSRPMRGGEKWHTDPTAGMIADNRSFAASQKLPYTYFFEGLVRQCLLNYLRTNAAAVTQLVFAYGSNMCSGRFRDYGISPEGPGRAAILLWHHLLFNKKSAVDGSGKANVAEQAGSKVWGVLYAVSDSDLAKLDKGEGGYRRVRLAIGLTDGTNVDAWVYFAKKPSNDPGLRPYTWYKRLLIEGAREHTLPADYIAELEKVAAVEDPDQKRDQAKRSLTCGAKL